MRLFPTSPIGSMGIVKNVKGADYFRALAFSLRRRYPEGADVVEQDRFRWKQIETKHFPAHHISQKSVPKCRFLPASPRGEAFFSNSHYSQQMTWARIISAPFPFIRFLRFCRPAGVLPQAPRRHSPGCSCPHPFIFPAGPTCAAVPCLLRFQTSAVPGGSSSCPGLLRGQHASARP